MRVGWSACGLFACISAAFPAHAQSQSLPLRDAEVALAGYADCVVTRKAYRAPVTTFLRTVPESPDFNGNAMKAADMSCLNAAAARQRSKLTLRIQPEAYREALYPALYRRDFGKKGPPTGIAKLPPLQLSGEFTQDAATLPEPYRPGRALGDCVSRRAPQAVHALLMAKPDSAKEDVAAQALQPALGACLPEGKSFKFTRATLRAWTGEAMYKLSVAAAPVD